MTAGPLRGVRVIEVGGIGPGPFAGMQLADLGADVIRIDRPGATSPLPIPPERDLMNRGKRMVALDLKRPEAVEALLELVRTADVLIEGFRPGVAERLGFGPSDCHKQNAALVYGRITGWGQDGPWAHTAGHDVNYVSATGALHAIGQAGGPPTMPLNLLGDFAGGSCYLVMGLLAALLRARSTGDGEVVDAAIVDGVSHLLTGVFSLMNSGVWQGDRGTNVLDGGAPYYRLYETADGRHMAVGPIEPAFWNRFLELLGVNEEDLPDRSDPAGWTGASRILAQRFRMRTLKQWSEVFEGTDACVSAVVSLAEAPEHPQIAARGSIREREGWLVSGAAPRFSHSPTTISDDSPLMPGSSTVEVLAEAGLNVDALIASGAAEQASPLDPNLNLR